MKEHNYCFTHNENSNILLAGNCPLQKAYAAGAKAERERVLKELLVGLENEKLGFYCFPHPKATLGNGLSRFVLLDDLTSLVESLRGSQEEQE